MYNHLLNPSVGPSPPTSTTILTWTGLLAVPLQTRATRVLYTLGTLWYGRHVAVLIPLTVGPTAYISW